MLTAVAYVRVSTEEQNPENQKQYLQQWAEKKGIRIVKYYVDVVSGASQLFTRPAFKQMVEDVRKMTEKPKILLVYEISRLVRNFQELYKLVEIVEGELGMLILSTSEREQFLSSLEGIHRQFLRTLLAYVATMEREFIRQRTKTAMARVKAEGKITNASERNRDIANDIVEYYKKSGSIRETAKRFGLSVYSVLRILTDKGVYKPAHGVCPRCFSKMSVEERTIREEGGKLMLIERWYCKKCGYEEVKRSSA